MQLGTCKTCGKAFSYYPSNSKGVYCSHACRVADGQTKRITTVCPECGKEFWYYQSWPRKYCSKACSAKYARANLGEYARGEVLDVHCDQCGKTFKRSSAWIRSMQHTFCSQRCFGDWQAIHRRGKNHPAYARVEQTCQECGKTFLAHPAWIRRGESKFCSRYCSARQMERICGPNHPAWRGGHLPYYGPNWYAQRRAARKRDNYTCQRCGKTEQDVGQRLDVHHIQPFRIFGLERYKEANHVDNLACYCKHCHKTVEIEQERQAANA